MVSKQEEDKCSWLFLMKNNRKSPYKLFERYSKELSDNPYGAETYSEKCRHFCLIAGWSYLPFFKSENGNNSVPSWTISDEAMESIVKFMGVDCKLGFIGLSPSVLHNTWELYMLPHLFALWCKFIYGDDENIVPDYKNFCLLVKVQVRGTLEDKGKVILEILLEKGFTIPRSRNVGARGTVTTNSDEGKNETVTKYAVIRYLYDLTVSYFYGLGRSNNPEYLLWESCYAGLNERNLRMCMKYYTLNMNYTCNEEDIYLLLNNVPFLRTILNSAVSMMFGSSYSLNIVPFLNMPRETILDVSQATFLTSIMRGDEDKNFEMEMIYSQTIDGVNFSTLHKKIIRQGPTFVIVKDEMGYVFGGYASVSWTISTQFFGNRECFLFRLLPNVVVCGASDVDTNFMYLNTPKASVPAYGLGMGGSLNNFGFWLDLSSEEGRCAITCSTFDNYECLSSNPMFVYVQLEMWRVNRRHQKHDRPYVLPTLRREPSEALNLLKGDYTKIIDKTMDEIESVREWSC